MGTGGKSNDLSDRFIVDPLGTARVVRSEKIIQTCGAKKGDSVIS